MLEDSDIRALEGLKLTHTQARVYLAIAELGDAEMSAISKEIDVPRQDLYRATSELHNLGLVEKVLSTPIKHRAIPVGAAIAILWERIHKENVANQENALRLAEKYKNRCPRTPDKTSQFTIVPKKEANVRRRQLLTQKCLNAICEISSHKRLCSIPHNLLEEILASLQRGVKIRAITEKFSDTSCCWHLTQFQATGNFEIRYLPTQPSIILSIFDEKEVLIASSSKAHIGKVPALWTNNSDLVTTLQDYFEILWQKSIKHDDSVLANINA